MRLFDADDAAVPGELFPAHPTALVLVHDVFGLTNQMRYAAQRFAAEGFTTFAVDLFDGRTAADPALGAKLAQSISPKAISARLRSAVEAVAAHSDGALVGICGFGFGGVMAVTCASQAPELAGCVTFYGLPTAQGANLLSINCCVQGHFGLQDHLVTKDRVDAVEARLTAAGMKFEFHRYNTQHFFFNEVMRATYSPHNALLAFRRTVAFLKRELKLA